VETSSQTKIKIYQGLEQGITFDKDILVPVIHSFWNGMTRDTVERRLQQEHRFFLTLEVSPLKVATSPVCALGRPF
jgi:hypothetical protein